ncbi:MAG: hypothetical protein JW881_20770 [Spirochaetales bacterium]|nr:hypothetical protein [Spirochaetales bacterium]
MLKKTGVVSFIIVLSLSAPCYGKDTQKTILFMPFLNEGSVLYDRLETYIPNYLYEPVKHLSGFTAIPYSRFHEYMVAHCYDKTDLKRQNVIASIASDFDTDYIISGTFSNDETAVTIIFTIYRRVDVDLETHNSFERIGITDTDAMTLNTRFDSLIGVCEKITEHKLSPGFLSLHTTEACLLFIDGVPSANTPVRLPLTAGEHTIRLVYRDENGSEEEIFKSAIAIEEGRTYTKEIDVLVPLVIESDEECTVYIDQKKAGKTIFRKNLFWGREYLVEALYEKENRTVFSNIIDTTQPISPIILPSKGSVSLDFSSSFSASIDGEAPLVLPHTYGGLVPDIYRLRVFLDDPAWKKKWLIYDRRLEITPFSSLSLEQKEIIDYRDQWGLMFVPSALQFYNREPVKGALLLSAFTVSTLCTGISAFGWFYFDGEHNRLVDKWKKTGRPSFINEANDARDMKDLCGTLIISGIVGASASWLYSAIDGTITNRHLYELIRR